ncbi:hypothetical protein [Thiomicrospira sp. ALE5]|uniref:hypothetical protein n=1 Tax=Thiomicrospira sp. ALE5 TaxID=748650 RepID=UPI0008EA9441|nr:hypothetical protein [Thiomicrospira sp. ALE5]SFR49398.1 hypothetical protein SAMN03092900_0159 [Thiomicrospira sp. ALE5]
MYVEAFETDITSPFIEFKDYARVLNKHVKVFIVTEDGVGLNNGSASIAGALSKYAKPELMDTEKQVAWQAVADDKA